MFHLRRNLAVQAHHLPWNLVQDGVEDRPRIVASKRKEAGSHFVEHDPKGKEVGARVKSLAEHLLRRHVCNGSERATRARQILGVRSAGGQGSSSTKSAANHLGAGYLREAEIEDFHMAPLRD